MVDVRDKMKKKKTLLNGHIGFGLMMKFGINNFVNLILSQFVFWEREITFRFESYYFKDEMRW